MLAKQNTVIGSALMGEIGIPRLMAIPSNINKDTVVAENEWMSDDIKVDRPSLSKQWMDAYKIMSIDSPVFIMPDNPHTEVPSNDLIFAANSGLAIVGKDRVTKYIVSRFKAVSRRTETPVIANFVKNIFGEENVIIPPETFNNEPLFFEGEADIKAIAFNETERRANVYIVGVGIRTNETFCKWLESEFDVIAIPYKAPEDIINSLYHLDCLCFPLDRCTTLLNTYGIDKKTIREIEKYTEIVPLGTDDIGMMYNGITNSIRIKNAVMMPFSPDYSDDKMSEDELEEYVSDEYDKLDFMSEVCDDLGLQLITIDVSAGFPLGAQLSCFTCSLVDQFELYYNNGI